MTKDGALVVSINIANFFDTQDLIQIDVNGLYFFLFPSKTIAFDANRRQSVVGEICPTCGINKFATGAEPMLLDAVSLDDYGVYRTDIHFANGEYRRFKVVCGLEIGNKIKALKPKGLFLEPAYGRHDTVITRTGVTF